MVDASLEAGVAVRPPRDPQLEDVIVSAALDSFVASVIDRVVLFVLLEQVVRSHRVALRQQALTTRSVTSGV